MLGLESNELVKLIQKKYDEPYLSNVILTGSLSLSMCYEVAQKSEKDYLLKTHSVRKLLHRDFLDINL